MTRDGPDKLETIEEGRQGIVDGLEVALVNILKLALEGHEELDKVLGDGVFLLEVLLLLLEGLHVEAIGIFLYVGQDLNDPAHAGHA